MVTKRKITLATKEKGAAALVQYRKDRAEAKTQGGEVYKKWEEDLILKRAQKKTSPLAAISNFCTHCVGNIKEDITNCTATKCPLYIYRPYQ